jgi:hypothetical protein
MVRLHLRLQPCGPLSILMKAGKSLGCIVCVALHLQRRPSRTPLVTSPSWRKDASIVCLPPTGGWTDVSPPVASTTTDFGTTCGIASSLRSLLLHWGTMRLRTAPSRPLETEAPLVHWSHHPLMLVASPSSTTSFSCLHCASSHAHGIPWLKRRHWVHRLVHHVIVIWRNWLAWWSSRPIHFQPLCPHV